MYHWGPALRYQVIFCLLFYVNGASIAVRHFKPTSSEYNLWAALGIIPSFTSKLADLGLFDGIILWPPFAFSGKRSIGIGICSSFFWSCLLKAFWLPFFATCIHKISQYIKMRIWRLFHSKIWIILHISAFFYSYFYIVFHELESSPAISCHIMLAWFQQEWYMTHATWKKNYECYAIHHTHISFIDFTNGKSRVLHHFWKISMDLRTGDYLEISCWFFWFTGRTGFPLRFQEFTLKMWSILWLGDMPYAGIGIQLTNLLCPWQMQY